MASPWGDSRYPQFPGRYPPNPQPTVPAHSYEQRRSQYVQPTMPGFYNPAMMPLRQPPYAAPPHMPMPPPHFPPALQPGSYHTPPYRSASGDISGDLFFQNPPSFPKPHIPSLVVPQLTHSISAPAPPLPKKPDFNQPPLPPKPSFTSPPSTFPSSDLYPQNVQASITNALPQGIVSEPAGQVFAGASPTEKPFIPESRVPEPRPSIPDYPGRSRQQEEEEQLKQALEQSAKYAEAQKKREDEELARAMEESLKVQQRTRTTSGVFPSLQISSSSLSPPSALKVASASPSTLPETEFNIAQTASPSSYFPSFESGTVSAPAGLRKAQSSYFPPAETGSSSRARPSSSSSSPLGAGRSSKSAQQIVDDEALARSLMEEDERSVRRRQEEEERDKRRLLEEQQARRGKDQKQKKELTLVAVNRDAGTNGVDGLPQYSEVASKSPSPASQPSSPTASALTTISSVVPPDQTLREPSPIRPSPPDFNGPLHRSTSANAVPTISPMVPSSDLRAGRSHSFTGGFRPPSNDLSSPSSPDTPPQRTPNGHPLPPVQESSEGSSSGGASSGSNGAQPSVSVPSTSPMAPNQLVDPELLLGVSMGFNPPAITARLTPMAGPIPNVIALPYGRSPPLHVKSPTWRHMLQLMARLSDTRVEPSIEAQALVKTTMQLRVVLNFVKVHQSSNDWHVVLYMTIDLPVPADYRYKARTMTDPSLLPYSYSLSPTPAFLRESSDSPLSKWYSIPATPATPFPTLPITFPDLATYLMNALEDSRSAMHDRSSGLNRLAKAIDAIYPNQSSSGDDEAEERPGLLGRLFGRGHKPSRPANDERSNLVTPFYADAYGR